MHMLAYIITGDSVHISDADRAYIEKRFRRFERFVDEAGSEMAVTASKTTAKEREDAVRVEVRFGNFFATADAPDLLSAVDLVKEELMRQVTKDKAKRVTLFHRSARRLKRLIKRGMRLGT